MSKYEVNNNRFKKDGKRISKEDVSKELNKEQFKNLIKNGKYSTRDPYNTQTKKPVNKPCKKTLPPIISETIEKPNITTKIKDNPYIIHTDEIKNLNPSKKELKEAEKIKSLYKVEQFKSSKGLYYDLWRLNKRFGYYNFACHINGDSESDIIEGIIQDLRNQKEEAELKIIPSF